MAKQTFTTGQVLTAAQMTSLQQTAMGGGQATAKTANYVLVAADAGTTVIMNAAGATTITVNTALFAAGDTVNIQNIGAGICTVTAGTATVNTAGSLALNQYEGGVLYFRSASAATFFDYVQTGSVSPLTTKGDLYGFSTLDARVPIGTNNQVLTADSAEALGLKWATPAGGTKNFSLLGTGVLTSGSTVTVSGISGMDQIMVMVGAASGTGIYAELTLRINGDTAANYDQYRISLNPQASYAATIVDAETATAGTSIRMAQMAGDAASTMSGYFSLFGCNTAGKKMYMQGSSGTAPTTQNQIAYISGGTWNNTATVTSISLRLNSGTFDNGNFYVYGSA
jgi:hypothetical protein